MRERARRNPYFFGKALLGYKDLTSPFHQEMLDFLCSPSRRKGLFAWRGSLKSSAFRVVIWWKGLNAWEVDEDGTLFSPPGFEPDYSCWYIEQKYENAEGHHRMIQNVFRYGPQAALLQDLYRHRIEDNSGNSLMMRWTMRNTFLVQNDPNAEPFITIGSLDAKLEGGHKVDMFCDDLEGADADVSIVPNRESKRFLFNRADYLLREPTKGMIVVGGTPHGEDPLSHVLYSLSQTEGSEWDVFWRPLFDENGKSYWEERFPTKEYKLKVKLATHAGGELQRGVETQLLLLKRGRGTAQVDMSRVSEGLYRMQYVKLNGKTRLLLFYRKSFFNQSFVDIETGLPRLDKREASIDIDACRLFMHADPAHKDASERISSERPSKWAIVVVAVAPDWNAFVVDTWAKQNSSVDEFLEEWLKLYRRWAPRVAGSCTFDPVGAQTWIKNHLRMLEQWKYPKMKSLPTPWRPKPIGLPRPSTHLVEAHKAGAAKIENIVQNLQAPFHMGWLHLRQDTRTSGIHPDQQVIWDELEILGVSEDDSFDCCDALAQGPAVWQPPPSPEAIRERILRDRMHRLLSATENIIYERPWRHLAG